jgi:hypothetical protein
VAGSFYPLILYHAVRNRREEEFTVLAGEE